MKKLFITLIFALPQFASADGCLSFYSEKAEKSETRKKVISFVGGTVATGAGAIAAGPFAPVVLIGGIGAGAGVAYGSNFSTKWSRSYQVLNDIARLESSERIIGLLTKVNKMRSPEDQISQDEMTQIVLEGLESEQLCPVTGVNRKGLPTRKIFKLNEIADYVNETVNESMSEHRGAY